jgi:hypothetical protein
VSHLRVIFENLLEHGLLMRVWGFSGGADYENGGGSSGGSSGGGSGGGDSAFVKVAAAGRALLSAVYVTSSADPGSSDGGDRGQCPAAASATGTDGDGQSFSHFGFGPSNACAQVPSTAAVVLVVVMSWVATVGLVWLVEVTANDMQRVQCAVCFLVCTASFTHTP